MESLRNKSTLIIILILSLASLSVHAQRRGDRGGHVHPRLDQSIQDKIIRLERRLHRASRPQKRAIESKLIEALDILNRDGRPGHPPRRGFRLAAVVTACGQISNSFFANQCIDKATSAQMHAEVVAACTSIRNSSNAISCIEHAAQYNIYDENIIHSCSTISNTFWAQQCVKNAGMKNTNARQVSECVKIGNGSNANSCVEYAGEGQVPARAIEACVLNNRNSFYAAQCVRNLMR